MIWIIGAILLGSVLGILGLYFSRLAALSFVVVIGLCTLFLPSELVLFNIHGNVTPRAEGYAYLAKKLAGLPDHVQWAGLLFVIFFFVARIITWFLVTFSILPEVAGSNVDRIQRGIEEYSYDPDEYSWGGY